MLRKVLAIMQTTVGSESAWAGAEEAQNQGSSDAEENKEDEQCDAGHKESEIHEQQENVRKLPLQVQRPARFISHQIRACSANIHVRSVEALVSSLGEKERM